MEKEASYKTSWDTTSASSTPGGGITDSGVALQRNVFQRVADSFKPAEEVRFDTTGKTEEEIHNQAVASAPMKRTLQNRHIQLIALGGSLGSGLFLTTSQSLNDAGPAGVLIAFGIIAVFILFPMMCSLGEVAVTYPVQGSFVVHSSRFLDDSWGFAMAFNYVLLWIVTFPLELIASTMVIHYWDSDNNGATEVNKAAWIALFWTVFTVLGFFGARAYGEAEFILAITKIIAVIGFCIFGVCAVSGANPDHIHFGTKYYHDPGPFSQVGNPVKGICSVFVTSVFAFSGTEMAALASAETAKPQYTLPKAVRQVFWRVVLFYIVSLLIAFFLVPSNDCNLLDTCDGQDGSAAGSDGRSSIFVLAIKNAHVKGLPSVMNTVILLASLSVANTSVYACSRTMAAMANDGQLPKFLGYIDRAGRPLVALIITVVVGLIAFAGASSNYSQAFDWLVALSGQSTLFAWGSCGANLIRMRMAMRKQGRSLDQLAYKSPLGIPGAAVCVISNLAVMGLQFWVGLFPMGEDKPDAKSWFETYLATLVVVFCWVVHKAWYRKWPPKLNEIDLDSGACTKQHYEADEDASDLRVEPTNMWLKYLKRTFNYWC